MAKENFAEKSGSALILVVVLTSLLSILAVMFMLSSRVDKITASAISGNKELDFGVDSVVAKISQQLAADVPNGDPNIAYYDYPDENNRWLANLEPQVDNSTTPPTYYWRHISDINDKLGPQVGNARLALIVKDYQDPIEVGDSSISTGSYYLADADGDGVSDSVWVELPDVSSSKGKPVYAAVRVIDNSAMLNVNTAYLFDPNEIDRSRVDGSSQTQINLAALSQRGTSNGTPLAAATELQTWRSGGTTPNITAYEQNFLWKDDQQADKNYTPFDISDELELRNRFFIKNVNTDTRIKNLWADAFKAVSVYTPFDTNLPGWFSRAADASASNYSYRHIVTTYNMDRLVGADGMPMTNANSVPDANLLYGRLLRCIDPGVSNAVFDSYSKELAQIAANIKDSSDSDADVSIVYDSLGNAHYGFEKPCIFISELVYMLKKVEIPPGAPAYQRNWSYGIELSKLYPWVNSDNWRLVIENPNREIPLDDIDPNIYEFLRKGKKYHVIIFEDPCASLWSPEYFTDSPEDGETGVNPNVVLRWDPMPTPPADTSYTYDVYFGTDYDKVTEANNAPGMWLEFMGNQPYGNTSYDPALGTNTPYFWRIDDKDGSGTVVGSSGVWSFTTWASEPNVIFEYINKSYIFDANSTISLQRQVWDSNGLNHWLTVDSVAVPAGLVEEPNVANTWVRSFQRDMSEVRWIKRLWSPVIELAPGQNTLGNYNDFNNPGAGSMRARPAQFNNTGDLAMVFSKSTYYDTSAGQTFADAVGYNGETEDQVRIDLRDPNFQRIFQYVSAFAEAFAHPDSQGRIKAKGRININTAPWYVISQLPWVAQRRDNTTLMAFTDYKLAQAIAGYRDKTIVDANLTYADTTPISNDGRYEGTGLSGLREAPGFESIGELATVVHRTDDPITGRPTVALQPYSMRYYIDGVDQVGFPDIDNSRRTLIDNAIDDFEERYLIFSRISDLVTVRSDVFTAYVLVRVGNNGPQKRVIAILDRSDVPAGGKVKVIAVHPVPDPR